MVFPLIVLNLSPQMVKPDISMLLVGQVCKGRKIRGCILCLIPPQCLTSLPERPFHDLRANQIIRSGKFKRIFMLPSCGRFGWSSKDKRTYQHCVCSSIKFKWVRGADRAFLEIDGAETWNKNVQIFFCGNYTECSLMISLGRVGTFQ